jgi:ACS family tartrate transporter-like MFS transporter
MTEPSRSADGLGRETVRRVGWRLLPFLMLVYLVCYIDRTNAGFAALQMNKAVGISATAFGLGGGIFFFSYCLFEVPSNLALERFGARRWIARIMVSWGIVSGCMALTAGPRSFVLIRFLLGAAEAGFFPGVILYMTYWFPAEQRARLAGSLWWRSPSRA